MNRAEVSADRARLVSSLIKIPHGDLDLFTKDALPASLADPYLFAHLTAWNAAHGKVRDSQIAFPVLALRAAIDDDPLMVGAYQKNAVGCLMLLGPRELYRAYQYSTSLTKQNYRLPNKGRRWLEAGIRQYLLEMRKSKGRWDRAVLSSRRAMRGLYAVSHLKPTDRENAILFRGVYPPKSIFEVVRSLSSLPLEEAAALVLKHKIPMQVAIGALPKWKGNTQVLLSLVEGMSGNELLNSSAMLERLGVLETPALSASYRAAIERAKKDTRVTTFKGEKAAKKVSKKLAKQVSAVQREREQAGEKIDGNWLILADRSASMDVAVEKGKELAGVLAAQVTGNVFLVFFNDMPRGIDVTGKSSEEIHDMTRGINAGGQTSIGCGVEWAREKGLEIDGIILLSDGGENHYPRFYAEMTRYESKTGHFPSVYFLLLPGNWENVLKKDKENFAKYIATFMDATEDVDYYSMPNLVATIKKGRYGFLQEVLDTPLLTLDSLRI